MSSRHPDHPIKSSTVRVQSKIAHGLNRSLCSSDVLRVVRKGPAIKNEVDDAIDLCAEVVNLRDSIEESRAQCEQTTDERQKKVLATKGACSDSQRTGCGRMTQITLSFAEPKAVL